jgi:hypothetical protein
MVEEFVTWRQKALAMYRKSGEAFEAFTKPYKSTQQFDFVIPSTDLWPNGAITMGHAVLRAGSTFEFFSYKIGDNIPYGTAGATKQATAADTNITKPKQTNGNEDFIIEGMSLSVRGMRVVYPSNAYGTSTDNDVVQAYQGQRPMYDPASLAQPPQVGSPFNLENGIANALFPLCEVTFQWDRGKIITIGTLDQIPEGAGKSFLRANGDPRTDNRFRAPEGYVWRTQSKPDSEFSVKIATYEALVVPISFVALQGSDALTTSATDVCLDVVLRLHGLSLRLPSGN